MTTKGLPSAFIPKMIELIKRIPSEAKYLDAVLGFLTLGTLLALKHAKIRFSAVEKDDGKAKIIGKKVLWVIATLRNAFVLFVTSAYLFLSGNHCPFPVSFHCSSLMGHNLWIIRYLLFPNSFHSPTIRPDLQ